jgi:hypothetical protein
MKIRDFHVSKHAEMRMAQRNLTPEEIEVVLQHGRVEYRTGAKFFFLAKRNLPQAETRDLERLVGATVITAQNVILTVYRDRNAISSIRRKPKLTRSY